MRKLKTWIIWGFVVAALALAYALMEMNSGTPVTTAEAAKGAVASYVEERARTTLPRVYKVTMPQAGRIEPIAAKAGTMVEQGQIVAAMDTYDLDNEVEIARAEMDRVNAEIALNRDNTLELTALDESHDWITTMTKLAASAEEVIKANQAALDFSTWWLKAVKTLETKGAMADERLQAAEKDHARALVDLSTSTLNAQAAWAVKEIFDLGPTFVKQYIARKKLRTTVLEKQHTAAKLRLKRAERNRAMADIKAPISGIVLIRHEQNKRRLPAGAELLDIGRLEDLEITADILSQEAAGIKPGDSVTIYGQALGGAAIPGTVDRIRPRGFTKVSSLGVDQQRVPVIVRPDPAALKQLAGAKRFLGVDYRVRVRVQTGRAENAVIIPRTALFKGRDGSRLCYLAKDGKAVLAKVDVGLTNERQAQIKRGVNPGDKVIVAPPKTLVDGARIQTKQAALPQASGGGGTSPSSTPAAKPRT